MKTQDKATPRPWKYHFANGQNNHDGYRISTKRENPADETCVVQQVLTEKNASFITEAVNNYETLKAQRDALLDRLIEALPYVETALEDKGYKPGRVDLVVRKIKDIIKWVEFHA